MIQFIQCDIDRFGMGTTLLCVLPRYHDYLSQRFDFVPLLNTSKCGFRKEKKI